MICDRCYQGVTEPEAHGVGQCPLEPRRRGGGVIDDALPGGARWIENLGDRPVWVETKSQLQREMAARGLEPMVRHVPGDKHVTSWATMDPQTLENARILVSRARDAKASHDHDVEQYPVIETHIRRTGETFRVWAE